MLAALYRLSLRHKSGAQVPKTVGVGVLKALHAIKNRSVLTRVISQVDPILAAFTEVRVVETCATVEGGSTPVGGGHFGWSPVQKKVYTTIRRIPTGRKRVPAATPEELGYRPYERTEESGDPYGEYYTYSHSYTYGLEEDLDLRSLKRFLSSLSAQDVEAKLRALLQESSSSDADGPTRAFS